MVRTRARARGAPAHRRRDLTAQRRGAAALSHEPATRQRQQQQHATCACTRCGSAHVDREIDAAVLRTIDAVALDDDMVVRATSQYADTTWQSEMFHQCGAMTQDNAAPASHTRAPAGAKAAGKGGDNDDDNDSGATCAKDGDDSDEDVDEATVVVDCAVPACRCVPVARYECTQCAHWHEAVQLRTASMDGAFFERMRIVHPPERKAAGKRSGTASKDRANDDNDDDEDVDDTDAFASELGTGAHDGDMLEILRDYAGAQIETAEFAAAFERRLGAMQDVSSASRQVHRHGSRFMHMTSAQGLVCNYWHLMTPKMRYYVMAVPRAYVVSLSDPRQVRVDEAERVYEAAHAFFERLDVADVDAYRAARCVQVAPVRLAALLACSADSFEALRDYRCLYIPLAACAAACARARRRAPVPCGARCVRTARRDAAATTTTTPSPQLADRLAHECIESLLRWHELRAHVMNAIVARVCSVVVVLETHRHVRAALSATLPPPTLSLAHRARAVERVADLLTRACLHCMSAESDVALEPCRHVAVCAQCAPRVRRCPYCDAAIASRRTLIYV